MGSTEVTCIEGGDFLYYSMTDKAMEGDWQYVSDMGYDPVKVSVKNIMGSDWMVACMIPKGNMMASMLKKVEDGRGFSLKKFNCTNKDVSPENKELEAEFKAILEFGITNLIREGNTLTIHAGGLQKQLVEDDILEKQEEVKKTRLASAIGEVKGFDNNKEKGKTMS